MFSLQGGNLPAQNFKTASKLDAAANAAAAITIAAVAGKRHILVLVLGSYIGGTTTGKLTVTGGDVTWEVDLSGNLNNVPLFYVCAVNTALVVTLAAGGTGVTGKLNIGYITV